MSRLHVVGRAIHPWWILALGFAFVAIYAYPGYMSYDSLLQLGQARRGVYGDWHPPAMAAMWRLTDHVVAGPFGMLVLQLATFLAGGYLVMRRWFGRTGAAVTAVGLLWFPAISTLMAVVWKDCQMLGFLMLGLGLLLVPRRGAQLGGLVALGVASAVRHNGLTCTFALVILLFQWSPDHKRAVRYAIAFVAWIATTAAALGVNVALTDTEEHAWPKTLALTDIAGMLRYAPPISDEELAPVVAGMPMMVTHDIQRDVGRVFNPMKPILIFDSHTFRWAVNAEERAAVARTWKWLVLRYPGVYLRVRLRYFYDVNVLPDGPNSASQVWVGIAGDFPATFPPSTPDWRVPLQEQAVQVGFSWIDKPYIYLALLVVLAPLWIMSRDRVLIALALSAIGCEVGLFFLAPATTYRYLAWLTIVVLIIALALGVQWVGRARAARAR